MGIRSKLAAGNKKGLISRLLLFGALSQIPYILLFKSLQLNIMFSFASAALTFKYIRQFNNKTAILGIAIIITTILKIDYGWYGIVCPLMMISLKGSGSKLWWWGWVLANIGCAINYQSYIQIFAIFAPLILGYYDSSKNQKPSKLEKKFFYYFYPLHLAGLAALRGII